MTKKKKLGIEAALVVGVLTLGAYVVYEVMDRRKKKGPQRVP